MMELVVVPQSMDQIEALLEMDMDVFVIGEERYGLRLPTSFSREEQRQITEVVHRAGKKVTVALNGIMHPEKMETISGYLDFLSEIAVDEVLVGDTGVIHLLRQRAQAIPYWYDAHTMVTSAHQINFFGERGAQGAVLAREIPQKEMAAFLPKLHVAAEVLVFGPTCIHQSKRRLVQNYFRYEGIKDRVTADRGWFLSEPQKAETHYSIYEDSQGTHIFATDDLLMLAVLPDLEAMGVQRYKLDSILLPAATYLEGCQTFSLARKLLNEATSLSVKRAELKKLEEQIQKNYPENRSLSRGFYDLEPEDVK